MFKLLDQNVNIDNRLFLLYVLYNVNLNMIFNGLGERKMDGQRLMAGVGGEDSAGVGGVENRPKPCGDQLEQDGGLDKLEVATVSLQLVIGTNQPEFCECDCGGHCSSCNLETGL